MPVYQIKRVVRPGTLRCISPRALLSLLRPHRRFFQAQGLELPSAANAKQLDIKKLAHLLGLHELTPPAGLTDVLYYINEMATPEGMDALLHDTAGEEPTLRMFQDEPADVAVRAWLKNRKLVERKHAEIFASRPRRFEYFQSCDDPPPALANLTPEQLRPLELYLDNVFDSKNRGRGTRVLAYPRGTDCLFMIRHGDARRREGALKGSEETSVLYRPLRFDIVGYDVGSGTLRVCARTRWETSLYRGAFGQHLFGAMDHFPATGRYTLDPLLSGDRACLVCADAAPIKYVVLTEVQLRWGGIYDALEVHRARDVLAALQHRSTTVPRGPRLEQASFDVFVFGQKQARSVTIIPPNIARYSHEDECQMIDQWLTLRGFIIGRSSATYEQTPDTLLQMH